MTGMPAGPTASVLDPRDVPALSRRLDGAVEAFLRSRRFVCRHVSRPAVVLFLCAQHPLQGLRCADCMPGHLERHDRVEEATCDSCRRAVDDIGGVVLQKPLSVAVCQARGQRGLLVGRIFVGGLGLCLECAPRKAAA